MAKIIDCHNHLGADLLFYLQGNYPYAQDLPTMVEIGGGVGVDYWMAFPMVSHLGLDIAAMREGRIEESRNAADIPYAFENRRMMEEIHDLFPEQANRILPLPMVDPLRKIGDQVRELTKLHDQYKFAGLKIQATIIQAPIRNLLDHSKVFLELAEEWDLPFLIHTSYNRADIWSQSHDICDIAEQTPNVRFCLAHSCRFEKSALDRIAALPNAWFDCSAHVIHCRGAARDMKMVPSVESGERFDSDYTNPARVLQDLAEAYPGKLMWGSDSPFYSYIDKNTSLACTYREELDCLKAIPEHLIEEVAWENTLEFLKNVEL